MAAQLVGAVLGSLAVWLTFGAVARDKLHLAATAGPLAVGFALTAGVLIAGPITGGAVNPARALGPMIVSGSFTSFYVYIVGPIVGGAIAALTYDRFIAKGKTPG